MAKKVSGRARVGKTVTRKVSRGPGKGDTVKFVANKSGTKHPGKLVPRRVIKDVAPKRGGGSLPIGKKKKPKNKKKNVDKFGSIS